jgi:hypothetical protein
MDDQHDDQQNDGAQKQRHVDQQVTEVGQKWRADHAFQPTCRSVTHGV